MTFRVPDNTTTNIEEFRPDQYVIPVAPELVQFILEKKKLTTYRFGKKYDYLKPGDKVNIQNSATKEMSADAIITSKSITTFKDLPVSLGNHEAYRDKEHQRQVLSGYYAYLGRPIKDDDLFLAFEFKLVHK